MSKIMLLTVLISLTGCLHARHSGLVIPAHCVRVSVESFTQPCAGLPDGRFPCNGVVITASCMAMPPVQGAGEDASRRFHWLCEDEASPRPGPARLGWFKVVGLFANREAETADEANPSG
jgi:hypothetical protein